MKSKIESNIYFLFTFFYFIINLSNIKCKGNKTEYKGTCLYLENDSGSKIIDFHKFKIKSKEDYKSFFLNESDSKHWSINICNDTIYKNNTNNTKYKYDSQIVWHNDNEIKRIAGPFYKYTISGDPHNDYLRNNWYYDLAFFINNGTSVWFIRGGLNNLQNSSGFLYFDRYSGSNDNRIGFRIVLTN